MILEESLVGSPLVQIVWQRLQYSYILAVTTLLFAFYVRGVGSGKPAHITKPHGVPTIKIRWIMVNGYHIPGTWYYTRSYAMRGVLVRVRLAPFVLLLSCGGHIAGAYWHVCAVSCDFYFVQMRCYTLLYTFFPDIMRMHAYTYQQMHNTCVLRLVHLYKAVVPVVCMYHTRKYCIFSTQQHACRVIQELCTSRQHQNRLNLF